MPTKMGWVVTRTTELATEAYFKEAIHKAKWRLRKRPERKNHQFLSLPCSPWFFIASERGQHQGGEHEPIGGDDQSWRIAELDKY